MSIRAMWLVLVLGLQGVGTCLAAVRTDCLDKRGPAMAVAEACNRNADCARIGGQYEYCPYIRDWLAAVAPADGRTVTAFDVERGLARVRAPGLVVSEFSVRFQDCVGSTFSRKECRIYLGLEPLPPDQRVADLDPATPAQHRAMAALLKEGFASRDSTKGLRGETREAMAACEAARDRTDRVAACHAAQERYDTCKRSQVEWDARRTSLIAELDARRPDLGHDCPGTSPGVPSTGRRTMNEWNCDLAVLRRFEIAGCPGFLPGSWHTPLQALAAWEIEDRDKAASARGGDAVTAKGSDAGFTSNLFQQSATQAARNPGAAATAASADARRRQQELDQLTANGQQRQAAILGGAVSQVTQAMRATAAGGGPTSALDAVNQSLTSAQQYAQGGAGAAGGSFDPANAPEGSVDEVPPPDGDTPGADASSEACRARLAAVDQESTAAIARRPPAGAVDALQYAMHVIQREISVLSGGVCAGVPGTSARMAEMRRTLQTTRNQCRQLASADSHCVPKAP